MQFRNMSIKKLQYL